MKRKMILFVLLSSELCLAAFEIQSINTSAIALGSISSIYPGSLNPAFQLQQTAISVRADYTQLYGLPGLNFYQIQMGRKGKKQNRIGLRISSLGNQTYQEQTFDFNYGQNWRDVISLGLAVNIYNIAIAGYQSSTAIGLTVGSVWQLNDYLKIALLFQNINSPTIYKCADPLPECFFLGFNYTPYSKIDVYGELFKDTEFPFSLRFGTRLKPLSFLELKTGAQFNPDRYSGGLSILWKNYSLDISIQHHLVLPYTIYYGIGYGF